MKYKVVSPPEGFKDYLDKIPVGRLSRDRKLQEQSLNALKEALLARRATLMNIGKVSTPPTMSYLYNQLIDGKISGLNLALSLVSEEISAIHSGRS